MLQMLNVDVKKSNTAYNEGTYTEEGGISGEEDFRTTHANIRKKNLVLPQLRGINPIEMNNSMDMIKSDDENYNNQIQEENKNDQFKPKM